MRDSLTHLGDRQKLIELYRRIQKKNLPGQVGILFLIDLNHLKEINDTFGHRAGDILIKETAQRLKGACRTNDVAIRLHGDEFAVLLEGNISTPNCKSFCKRLLACMKASWQYGDEIEFAGGYTTLTARDDLSDALERADFAMYEAKQMSRSQGSTLVRHTQGIERKAGQRKTVASDFQARVIRPLKLTEVTPGHFSPTVRGQNILTKCHTHSRQNIQKLADKIIELASTSFNRDVPVVLELNDDLISLTNICLHITSLKRKLGYQISIELVPPTRFRPILLLVEEGIPIAAQAA